MGMEWIWKRRGSREGREGFAMDSTKFERMTTIVIRRGIVFLLSGSVFFVTVVQAADDIFCNKEHVFNFILASVVSNLFMNCGL